MHIEPIDFNQLKDNIRSKKAILPFLIVVVIITAIGGFYFWKNRTAEITRPDYIKGYRLVNEKISQSAAISIYLPEGIKKAVGENNVEFYPEVDGEWLKSDSDEVIVFKPEEKLRLNRYYSVKLALTQPEESFIEADFLAVEDPEIIAVFPKENSETSENSEITIVFNRPMVPLTTLDYLEEKDVPVEITPETKGRFKWITTRNLQFIPEERLKRSSNYKVKIKSGMVSMDGLELEGTELSFITRKLRYLNLTNGQIVYDQPISIYFNQPVDLERIKKEISLRDNTAGEEVSFVAEYLTSDSGSTRENGKSWIFGNVDIGNLTAKVTDSFNLSWSPFENDEEENDENINKSIVRVYNKDDKFGREKLWDFGHSYSLEINKAYPVEGDIDLNENRRVNVGVADVIRSISAESEKTRYATANFFDPQGKLWVDFYEEIDLDKSKIEVEKLKDIGYGEKCKDEDREVSRDVECEKVPNKKRIFITFRDWEIGRSEELRINFKEVVNVGGLTINEEPIVKYVNSYPEFMVIKTSPQGSSIGASLTKLTICSNSPILTPAIEDYGKYFEANLDYEISYWSNSYKITTNSSYQVCSKGEFSTVISYGLTPLSDYSLKLNLEDVFNQKASLSLGFTTGEMPSSRLSFYHLQRPYNVTSPEKTKLTYAVKNMTYMDLEICEIGASDFLYYLEVKLQYDYHPANIINCRRVVRDRIYLPEKYWIKNYFNVDLEDYFEDTTGHYILSLSHPDYKRGYREKRQVFERSYLTVTNLAVAEKRIDSRYTSFGTNEALSEEQLSNLQNFYWVTDLDNLNPVSGAIVTLYQDTREKGLDLIPAGSFVTNDQGIALTKVIHNLKGVIIAKGSDSTVIPSGESRLNYASSAFSAEKIYLYTDKAIYQPGQKVSLKGIHRIGYDDNYEISQGKKVDFKIYNSRNDEIFSKELEINDFGTFTTELVLNRGASLGMYRACAERYKCVYFDVQEYVPAPFEVKAETDKEEYISKDTTKLKIEADYYFGVPVEGGEVTYTISSQNYYFDRYSGEYFNFGSGWHYWYPPSYGEKFILRDKVPLDNKGRAEISQLLDFEKLFKNEEDRRSKVILVDMAAKNYQGQSVSVQKSFIVHAGEIYLGLKPDKSFVGKDEEINLKIKTVDTQGNGTRVRNIDLNLYKIKWDYNKRLGADGGYHYKWEKQRDLVKKYNFSTDGSGDFTQKLKMGEEGSYEIEAKTVDNRGNSIFNTYNLYVYGKGRASVRPTENTELEIETEDTNLEIGDEAKLIIKSPYDKAKALISIERGEIFDYEIKNVEGNIFNYNFQIKEDYIPNVYVSVLLVSSKPEVKFGKVEFKVDTERRELNIEVKSNKKRYLPGEEVTLDILAKDYKGEPASVEFSVSVVDLSVLALKGNPKKNPLVFFYGGFPLTVSTRSNIKDILVEKSISTKGGGGGAMAGEADSLARKQRGEFKETAFWQAVVRTNNDGRAQIKFTLPDNLTTWQAETIGLTKDTKIGVNYQEFLTRKELMVIPLKPRFVVPGDVFYIGAKIFNQSEQKQKLNVTFDSLSLILVDNQGEKKVTLGSDETDTVYFKVKADPKLNIGEHKFILSAENDQLEDTVQQSIDITRNDTYEVTATANYTSDSVSKEYVFLPDNVVKDRGSLSIKSSATLAVFLSDSLNYLLGYPYGCSEQIASRLKSIAIVRKGLNLPNLEDKFNLEKIKYDGEEYSLEEVVDMGLAKIYSNQHGDGGFSYWKWGDSNFYVTLHVTDTLQSLSLAGFDVNQNSLNRAGDYLYKEITRDRNIYQNKNNIILAAYTLFNLPDFDKKHVLMKNIVEIANNDLFIQEQISNSSLAYLAIVLTDDVFDKNLKDKIFDVLDNRIDIDARGSFLESNQNRMWRYYETPIKNTALYLKALSTDERENPIVDKVLRWLLNNRNKDGAWGSTNNTITVVDAFTDFLTWKRETESDFSLEMLINDQSKNKADFNSETILNQLSQEFPLQDLKFDEINTIEFLKTDHNELTNSLYYDLALKYYLPANQIPPRDEGFSITREFYRLDDKENKNPMRDAKVGEVLRGHLQVIVPESSNFVMVEDYIPAGMEIINLDLATEDKSLRLQESELKGRELRPDYKEIYNDRVFLYKERLGPGVYEFDYFVRVLTRGKFTHLPAHVSEMYFPETFGRTDGRYFEVK